MAPLNWEEVFVQDVFEAPTFSNTRNIERAYGAPRFGHTRNILYLLMKNAESSSLSTSSSSPSSSDGRSYLIGTLICSILIFSLVTVWTLILLMFKSMGYKKVGFLSGTAPKIPPRPKAAYSSGGSTTEAAENSSQKDNFESYTSLHLAEENLVAADRMKENGMGDEKLKMMTGTQENQPESLIKGPQSKKQQMEERQVSCARVVTSFTSGIFCNSANILPTGVECVRTGDGGREHNKDQSEPNRPSALIEKTMPSGDSPRGEVRDISSAVHVEGVDHPDQEEKETSLRRTGLLITSNNAFVNKRTVGDDDEVDKSRRLEESKDEELNEWIQKVQRVNRQMRRIRIAVLLCGVGILASSVIYMKKGIDSLSKSLDHTQTTVSDVEDICHTGIAIIDEYLAGQDNITERVRIYREDLNLSCPSKNTTLVELCVNVSSGVTTGIDEFDISPICNISKELLAELGGAVQDAWDWTRNGMFALRKDLEEILDMTSTIDKYLVTFSWSFIIAAFFEAILCVIVICIMWGVILAWQRQQTETFQRLRSYFIIPLFLFDLFLTWLFTAIFVWSAIIASDFCIDSPDDVVLAMLEYKRNRFISILYDLVVFYISGCKTSPLPEIFEKTAQRLKIALDVLHSFNNYFAENGGNLGEFCGLDTSRVQDVASLLDVEFHIHIYLLADVREFFFCSNFNPLYTTVAYNAICYDGINGLTWIFGTQFMIAFFSMVILTLRVAWHNIEEDSDSSVETIKRSGEDHGNKTDVRNNEVSDNDAHES